MVKQSKGRAEQAGVATKDAMNGSEAALTGEVARQSVERLREGLAGLAAETSALLRWLLGVLVALNLAGLALVVVRTDVAPIDDRKLLMTLFATGIGLAILGALLSLLLAIPLARQLRSGLTAWTETAASGVLSDEALDAARQLRLLSAARLGSTCAAAVASLISFSFGCAVYAAPSSGTATAPLAAIKPKIAPAPDFTSQPQLMPVAPVATPTPPPKATPTPEPKATPQGPTAAELRRERLAKEKAAKAAQEARAKRIERLRERRRARAAAAAAAQGQGETPPAASPGPQ